MHWSIQRWAYDCECRRFKESQSVGYKIVCRNSSVTRAFRSLFFSSVVTFVVDIWHQEVRIEVRAFLIRKLTKSLHTLVGNMAPVRNVKFFPCGSLFTMMEAGRFLFYVLMLIPIFGKSQIIDFFGEISGIAFDPRNKFLYRMRWKWKRRNFWI